MISRRITLGWIAAATAGPWLAQAQTLPPDAPVRAQQVATWKELNTDITAQGYGQDPDLVHPAIPWPLTLDDNQRAMVRLCAGLMLPADAHSPSAATLPIDGFVDEWVSAPYPQQARDRHIILSGLAWLDAEAMQRFHADFQHITDDQRTAIFDLVAWKGKVGAGYERPSQFFARLRGLVMAGFYSLPEGYNDIGYIGNTPSLAPYPGPTPEALAHFQAAMTKLGLKS
jgi:gluconate 2-dehydrogenase subunit 3-like protein